jgi:hypothetical protein
VRGAGGGRPEAAGRQAGLFTPPRPAGAGAGRNPLPLPGRRTVDGDGAADVDGLEHIEHQVLVEAVQGHLGGCEG